MCCVPGRSKSNGCWQLGAKAGRQAAVMTALTRSSSAIVQRLCHLLSLHTWRWASQCLPPLLFFSLFALWSLQREEMREEQEADGKGMGRKCSPSLNGSQDLIAGTGELLSAVRALPSQGALLAWPQAPN